MKVERDFYLQFYPILHARFLRKAYTEDMAKSYEGRLSFDVWDAYDSVEEKRKIAVFFAGVNGRCGVKYFYSRYLAFEKDSGKQDCNMDRLILFKALVFIGIDRGKKLDNGLVLDFDTLLARKEWHKANSPKLLDQLQNLFLKNPTKYLEEQSINYVSLHSYNSAIDFGKKGLNDLLYMSRENLSQQKIDASTKDFFYKLLFDLSENISNRYKIVSFFSIHKLLTTEEIINLLHHPTRAIFEETIYLLRHIVSPSSDVKRILKEASDVLIDNNCGPSIVSLFITVAFKMDFETSLLVIIKILRYLDSYYPNYPLKEKESIVRALKARIYTCLLNHEGVLFDDYIRKAILYLLIVKCYLPDKIGKRKVRHYRPSLNTVIAALRDKHPTLYNEFVVELRDTLVNNPDGDKIMGEGWYFFFESILKLNRKVII